MAYSKDIHRFPAYYAGNRKEICVHRFDNGSEKKKVYIQANLHADETPGVLAIHYLLGMLKDADEKGDLKGKIIIVPSANPIGPSQWNNGQMTGRFDETSGINFNRNFPEVTELVAEAVKDKLLSDPEKNISIIRKETGKVIEEIKPANESEYMKKFLFSLAFDSDIVLDLHCDFDALCHIYIGTPLWEEAKDLSKYMGAYATLLAENSGGEPFDEACSKTFWELQEKFPDYPIPSACLSATIELRGQADVSHEQAKEDASNLFSFLKARGFVKGEPDRMPELLNDATPLEGVQQIVAEEAGVIVYRKKPGDLVKEGEVVADIYNPLEDTMTEIKSEIDGLLFAVRCDRVAYRGLLIGKIAGKKSLKGKGKFLLTP